MSVDPIKVPNVVLKTRDARIALMRAALAKLEEANDIVCGGRSQVAYEQMLLDGQADALLALDEARREARELLKTES